MALSSLKRCSTCQLFHILFRCCVVSWNHARQGISPCSHKLRCATYDHSFAFDLFGGQTKFLDEYMLYIVLTIWRHDTNRHQSAAHMPPPHYTSTFISQRLTQSSDMQRTFTPLLSNSLVVNLIFSVGICYILYYSLKAPNYCNHYRLLKRTLLCNGFLFLCLARQMGFIEVNEIFIVIHYAPIRVPNARLTWLMKFHCSLMNFVFCLLHLHSWSYSCVFPEISFIINECWWSLVIKFPSLNSKMSRTKSET